MGRRDKRKVRILRSKSIRRKAASYDKIDHDELVNKLADEYLSDGYYVEIGRDYFSENGRILFEVDLLAKKDNQLRIIEIKGRPTKTAIAKLQKQLYIRKDYFDSLDKYSGYTITYRGVAGLCS